MTQSVFTCTILLFFRGKTRLTSPEELQGTQRKSEDDGVGNPFALDDKAAEDEQPGRDVDAVHVFLGAKRLFGRHGVLWSGRCGRRVAKPSSARDLGRWNHGEATRLCCEEWKRRGVVEGSCGLRNKIGRKKGPRRRRRPIFMGHHLATKTRLTFEPRHLARMHRTPLVSHGPCSESGITTLTPINFSTFEPDWFRRRHC